MHAVRNSLFPYLLVSTAFHLLLVLSWYGRPVRQPVTEMIPVMVLPPVAEEKAEPAKPPRQAASAKLPREKPAREPLSRTIPTVKPTRESFARNQTSRKVEESDRKFAETDPTKEKPVDANLRRPENEIIVNQPLPTLKELLPPTYRPFNRGRDDQEHDGSSEEAISLATRDPRYVNYVESVKRAINLEWLYPETAKQFGLKGTVVLEFTIEASGKLGAIRLIRSSGSPILDEEVIRAVRAASPYRALPPSIGHRKLFSGSFEYVDDRLRYSYTP